METATSSVHDHGVAMSRRVHVQIPRQADGLSVADLELQRPPSQRPRADRRVVRAVGFVPIEVKLSAPVRREGDVVRGQLVDRLREAASVPVVLITAPAGYGKTTLLSQWDDEDRRPFAWLTLDQNDNDPDVVLTYLMLALQRIEPVDPGALAALIGAGEDLAAVTLPRLGRMVARRERPFVLVLDDA